MRKDQILQAINNIRKILVEKAKNRRLLASELMEVEGHLQQILLEMNSECPERSSVWERFRKLLG